MTVIGFALLTGLAESGHDEGDSIKEASNIAILSIDGVSKELQFNSVTPSGPNSFYVVNDNEVYIADQYDKKINYYKNKMLEKEILFPDVNFITDFYIADNELFLLDDYFSGAYRINDVICADMDGNIKYKINIPNDSTFLEMKNANNYDRRCRVRRIYDTNSYITCEFSNSINYIYTDSEWIEYKDDDLQKNINTHMVTFNKWSNSIIQSQGEIEYADVIKTNKDVLIVSVGAVIKEESSYSKMQCLYMINEKGVSWVQPVKTKANSVPDKQFFISEDNQIYQMYYDENNNTFISKLNPGEYSIRYSASESDPKHESNDISNNKITLASYSSITREQIENRATDFLNHTWTFNCYTNADDSILVGCTGVSVACITHQNYNILPVFLPQIKCTNSCNGHTVTGIPYCWTGQCEMRIPADAPYTHLQLYINDGTTAFDEQISNGYYAGNIPIKGNLFDVRNHYWLFKTAGVDCSGFMQVCFKYNDSAKINCNWIKNTTDDFDSISSLANAKAMDLLVNSGHVMIIDEVEWNSTYDQIIRVWVYECTTAGYDKVIYNDYTPSEISYKNYEIRRYKGVTTCTHSWSDWAVVVSPTCISTGKAVSTCSICGEVDTYPIPIIAHNYKPATCESPQTCWVCNATNGTALGHNFTIYQNTSYQPYSSTQHMVINQYKCSRCPELDDEIQYASHTYNIPAATCDTAKYCTVCGNVAQPAIGHSYSTATCVSAATCSNCGVTSGSKNPNNHSGGSHTEVSNPTCTVNGSQSLVCDGCGAILSTSTILAPGHSMSAWSVITASTCSTPGTQSRYCTNSGCGYSESSSIPALGHSWSGWVYQYTYYDPDWQSNVHVYRRTCTRCGAVEYDYI